LSTLFFLKEILTDESCKETKDYDCGSDIYADYASAGLLGEDPKRFERLQLIVATHSPFAFRLSHANYIEMNPGYLRECKEALKFAENTHNNEVIA